MARYRLDTLQDYYRRDYAVQIECIGCGRLVIRNAVVMWRAVKVRRIDVIERRLRCTACGHRGARIEPG